MVKTSNFKAFTLIETIVTIAIFALAIGVVASFIYYAYRSQNYTLQQAWAIESARRGVQTMVKEIREAKYGDDGSYILELADDQELIFYSDIDKDEVTERVHYFLEGSNFKKGVAKPTGSPLSYEPANEEISILSQYVRNGTLPIFTYYNGDYPTDTENNPLPTPTRLKETKLIHVYLRINVNPNRPPLDFELESDVQIRNLKTNL
jgi:prepilin-type N-terminal cleavage/methylation domain-containing protein